MCEQLHEYNEYLHELIFFFNWRLTQILGQYLKYFKELLYQKVILKNWLKHSHATSVEILFL